MLLQLQVSHLQFVSADALVACALAFGAAKIKIFHIELSATVQAVVPARTKLNLQFQAFEFCLSRQNFECELQCIGIYGRKLANFQADFHRPGARMTGGFHFYGFEHGLSDA
jgi:hypothetical protein